MPSFVMVSFHSLKTTVPSVRNRLNAALNMTSISTALRPLIMNCNGTLDSLITPNKNNVTARYIHTLLPINNEIMNTIVPISFTLGSNECITDSV